VESRGFPLYEEVSAKGYFWTPLHYAMHYGKFDIINFILKHAEKNSLLNYVIRCKSDSNRCPLLCLIRSNSIKINEKNDLLEKILNTFPNLYVSQNVINECKTRKISDFVLAKLVSYNDHYNKTSLGNFNKLNDIYTNLSDNQVRDRVITFGLSSEQKMALYNATIEGNVAKLKNLVIDNRYPMFEEISAKNYYWTALHYAMHYGKLDIILFIMKQAEQKNLLNLVLRCKSNDNRCPITCLIRSSSIQMNGKMEILDKLLAAFPSINITPEAIKEAKNKGFDRVLAKYNKI